jgi:hypothetical protein
MKIAYVRTAASIAALALFSGCANIENDQDRTRTEGALGGALLGAAIGGIIGNNSGHRTGEGMLIGGMAGGLAGLAVGDHVARKKAGYRNEEQWLDACIDHAERVNDNARAYNRKLSTRIDQLSAQIRAAKARGDIREQSSLKKQVLSLRQETRQQLKTVDLEIKEQQGVTQQSNSPGLRSRVSELRSTRSSLSSNEERLADLGNQIDV